MPFLPAPIKPEKWGHSQNWPCVTALVDHAAGRKAVAIKSPASRDTDDYGWSGTRTFDDACQIARSGWREGSEMAMKYSGMIWSRIGKLVFRPQVRHYEEGFEWDMDRVLARDPESALDYHNPPSKRLKRGTSKNVVKIYVTVDAYYGATAEIMKRRGAAIGALVNGLEQAGRRVELIATCATGRGQKLSHEIMVKSAGAKPNLPALCYMIGHPSVLRRMLFAVWEGEGYRPSEPGYRYFHGSYGAPAEHPCPPDADIVIGVAEYSSPAWKNETNCEKWVLEKLKEQGVIITGRVE